VGAGERTLAVSRECIIPGMEGRWRTMTGKRGKDTRLRGKKGGNNLGQIGARAVRNKRFKVGHPRVGFVGPQKQGEPSKGTPSGGTDPESATTRGGDDNGFTPGHSFTKAKN